MKRCFYCRGRIWPWQNRGWLTGKTGSPLWWHPQCRLFFQEES